MGLLDMKLILMRKEIRKNIGGNVAITPNSYGIIFKCNFVL